VEDGGLVVETHDVGVGRVVLDHLIGVEEGEVNIPLAAACFEGLTRGFVTEDGAAVGLFELGHFVVCFHAAGEGQVVGEMAVVDEICRHADVCGKTLVLAHKGDAAMGGQMIEHQTVILQGHDLKAIGPPGLGVDLLLVPEVGRYDLVVGGFLTGCHQHHLVGPVERYPMAEVTEGFKRNAAVVAEIVIFTTGMDQNCFHVGGVLFGVEIGQRSLVNLLYMSDVCAANWVARFMRITLPVNFLRLQKIT